MAFETEFDLVYDTLQDALGAGPVLTVSEVNARVEYRLESDPALQGILVRGEVSSWNVRLDRNGNPYAFFTLRDEMSLLSGVIWDSALSQLPRHPEKGETVRVRGSIDVYAARGVYQIQAESLIVENRAGALWQQYEKTKRKLEAEGLFAAERKHPLPRFPRQVGVITSLEGAVLHDIVRIACERHAGIPIVLFPASVQGEGAPASLIAALALANSPAVAQQVGALDVLILARGGGSIEDLWAFNDESVVRAVANSRIPVVSAVGHETDTVLTDFAADVRAPTPSAAAQMVFPDRAELRAQLRQLAERSERATRLERVRERLAAAHTRLDQACHQALERRQKTLLGYATRLAQCSPEARLARAREQLARASHALHTHTRHTLTQQRERLSRTEHALNARVVDRLTQYRQRVAVLAATLDTASPFAVLQRGYALLRDPHTHAVLTRVAQVSANQPIEIVLADGALRATITEVITHDDCTQ